MRVDPGDHPAQKELPARVKAATKGPPLEGAMKGDGVGLRWPPWAAGSAGECYPQAPG